MPVNGSAQDSIAINDRGFAYGDGLFETILIHHQQPVLLKQHLDRLEGGSQRLQIALDRPRLEMEIAALAGQFPAAGVLKIVVSRGSGGRGYRPDDHMETTRVISLHPLPDYGKWQPGQGIDVFVCKQRLAIQPALAGIKHLNRLEQVLASLEWPDDAFMEGLMLDMEGNVIEGTRSNLFWSESGHLMTPSLARCGVDGIMRQYLIRNLPDIQVAAASPLERILGADQLFVCNSVFGVWPVKTLSHDGQVHAIGSQGNNGPDYIAMAREAVGQLLASYADD